MTDRPTESCICDRNDPAYQLDVATGGDPDAHRTDCPLYVKPARAAAERVDAPRPSPLRHEREGQGDGGGRLGPVPELDWDAVPGMPPTYVRRVVDKAAAPLLAYAHAARAEIERLEESRVVTLVGTYDCVISADGKCQCAPHLSEQVEGLQGTVSRADQRGQQLLAAVKRIEEWADAALRLLNPGGDLGAGLRLIRDTAQNAQAEDVEMAGDEEVPQ